MSCYLTKACVSLLLDKVPYKAGLLVCCSNSSMRKTDEVNLAYSHVDRVEYALDKCGQM